MPRHLISDAHEWINEIPTVPIYYLAKPQPRERAWQNQRGKKTLDYELTLNGVNRCRSASSAIAFSQYKRLCARQPGTGKPTVSRLWQSRGELSSGNTGHGRRNARKGVGYPRQDSLRYVLIHRETCLYSQGLVHQS